MRARVFTAFLLALFVAAPPSATVGAPLGRQAAAATGSAKVWVDHSAEFEEYIRTADIDRFEDIPIGVTRPKRAYLKPGGPVASVAWKALPTSRKTGYLESYKSEIAAYEVDKLLRMNMVPVTVEKRWKGEKAAAILWLSPIHSWKEMEPKPKPPKWNRQAMLMKMFDNLIGNGDRNMGNLLVDDDWNLYLIDHSRAFDISTNLPFKMEHVDGPVWDRMLALDEPTLTAALGEWLDDRSIRAILTRRDRMKVAIAKLVHDSGEAAVIIR